MLPSRALPNKASIHARPAGDKKNENIQTIMKLPAGKKEKENKQAPAHRSIGALLNEALIHGDWSVTNPLAGNNVWSSDNHWGLPDLRALPNRNSIQICTKYMYPLLTWQHLLNSNF